MRDLRFWQNCRWSAVSSGVLGHVYWQTGTDIRKAIRYFGTSTLNQSQDVTNKRAWIFICISNISRSHVQSGSEAHKQHRTFTFTYNTISVSTVRNLTKSEPKFNVYRHSTRKTITLVKESEVLATYPAYYTLLYIRVLTILRNLLMNHWWPPHFFLWCFDPISGHGLSLWVSRSQLLDTPHLVGLIWTSVQHEQTPLPDNT